MPEITQLAGSGAWPTQPDIHGAWGGTAGDDAALAILRLAALDLADGCELSRLDDHQLVSHLASAGAARPGGRAGDVPALRPLAPAAAPAPAPAPPPAAAMPRSAPVAPPPAVEATFGHQLDLAAMVTVLVQAAQDGVPFCEECARAAAEAAA